MANICESIQLETLDAKLQQEEYILKKLALSPYSFSISFLQDKSVISAEDPLAQNKYKLNLNNDAFNKFIETIASIESEVQVIDGEVTGSFLCESASRLIYHIQIVMMQETTENGLESFYEIVEPFVIRGILMHLIISTSL